MNWEVGWAVIAQIVKVAHKPLHSSIRINWEFSNNCAKTLEEFNAHLLIWSEFCSNCVVGFFWCSWLQPSDDLTCFSGQNSAAISSRLQNSDAFQVRILLTFLKNSLFIWSFLNWNSKQCPPHFNLSVRKRRWTPNSLRMAAEFWPEKQLKSSDGWSQLHQNKSYYTIWAEFRPNRWALNSSRVLAEFWS